MNIILIGPPGSGKGVQAQLLSTQLGIPHLSVGALLRQTVEKKTVRGEEVKYYLERGELVPDTLTVRILLRRLGRKDMKKGFILDGFPRTLEQAKLFHKHVYADIVLLLHVPPRTTIKRITSRRQCSAGHIYGEKNPPAKKGVCDIDGTKLVQRKDDRLPIIRNRLLVYKKEMAPILKWYFSQELLYKIQGMGTIKTVHKRIVTTLKSFV
jgi:adenylate kinase